MDFRADRRRAREIIGTDDFIEIYVSTPLEECEKHVDHIIEAMKESGHLIEVKK